MVTIGVQLLAILHKLHSIGVVYNDLKCDNICLENNADLQSIKLIDFGLCSKYKNEYGSHIMPQEVTFKGNTRFCSIDALDYKARSRKDDIQSLFYFLISLYDVHDPFANHQNLNKK